MSRITLVSLYLNKCVHNEQISDLDLFRIPEAIFSSDLASSSGYERSCPFVHLSVTPFSQCFFHCIIK